MTNQEVFDKTARHLLTQKEPAIGGGTCRYRATNATGKQLSCAVGCLIPDELYSTGFENSSALTLVRSYVPIATLFEGVDVDLLQRLQGVHDLDAVENWKRELEKTATKFGLNADVLKEFE